MTRGGSMLDCPTWIFRFIVDGGGRKKDRDQVEMKISRTF